MKTQKQCIHPRIHRRSQQLNISVTPLKRILHKDLGMTPYKVQLVQELKPINHPMRFRFAPAIDLQNMPILAKRVISSDEAHFDRIWGTENPHAYIEKPTHSK